MKINAELVREKRLDRSWSQEELALAAGLNLRTVQRIESMAVASLQSKKSLAAALELDVRDLDQEEIQLMRRYETKTIEIEPKAAFLDGIRRSKLPDFTAILNEEGQQGWQLVQILTPDLARDLWTGRSGRYVALLQREVLVEVRADEVASNA